MQAFTQARTPETEDQFGSSSIPRCSRWAGRAARACARPGDIPVVSTDRGGQVTYHGPGQAIAYVLMDLKRRGYGVKEMVRRIEQAVIDLLEALRGER
jgi:lipoyl(octanoyl) transferase